MLTSSHVGHAARRAHHGGRPLGCLLLAALIAGCGSGSRNDADRSASPVAASLPLALRIVADSADVETLRVTTPPEVRAWVASVAPVRAADAVSAAASAAADSMVLPEPSPPPPLIVDADLKPPILRTPAALTLPPAAGRRAAAVELDVRVDEDGMVSDALWSQGSADSLLVRAAIESALGMRFYPALRSGRAVAVWCRQRFEFAAR